MTSKAQIIATIGPSSADAEIVFKMIENQADLIRLNFSWGGIPEKTNQIKIIREAEKKVGRKIPIIQDLPGPRIQNEADHTYDDDGESAFTLQDKEFVKFGAEEKIDYVALSFVGSKREVLECRETLKNCGGAQKIIAKIERKVAVDKIDEIIEVADAIMIARGDLGNEIPLEQIPFVQAMILRKCKKAGKPVITATQMMLSMKENPFPTRAEVTDVAYAILEGGDVVMLSEETASGKYPVESVIMMEKVILEAEKYMGEDAHFNLLK